MVAGEHNKSVFLGTNFPNDIKKLTDLSIHVFYHPIISVNVPPPLRFVPVRMLGAPLSQPLRFVTGELKIWGKRWQLHTRRWSISLPNLLNEGTRFARRQTDVMRVD